MMYSRIRILLTPAKAIPVIPAKAGICSIFILIIWLTPFFCNALPTDKNQPANISADSADLNQKAGSSQFIGNVIIIQGTTKITANKLTTLSDKNNKLSEAIAIGTPAVYQTIPKPGDKLFQASANEIKYLPNKNTVILIGNGQLNQAGNVLKSAYIVYNQKTGQLVTKAINNQRTTLTLQPKQNS